MGHGADNAGIDAGLVFLAILCAISLIGIAIAWVLRDKNGDGRKV